MKTFFNLIQEVHDKRLCHRCGGCVAFCTAINFGALEMGEDGRPRYKDKDKCIECGICYDICPEIDDLREETKRRLSWSAPIGRVLELNVARAKNPDLRIHARDGGVVTAILLHLFDIGRIDGAIVTKVIAPFICKPWLARTRLDIIGAGGFHFDVSAGAPVLGETYADYPPFLELISPRSGDNLRRIAFVGRPCQIETMRRMETMGVVPSETIKYYIGLFCMGNFKFRDSQQSKMSQIGGFRWDDVIKVNFKEGLQVHLANKEIKVIEFEKLDFMKRYACRHCYDYSAEFADLSCGGMGAGEGWTSVIVRSPIGRAIFKDAAEDLLEIIENGENQEISFRALEKIHAMSKKKKKMAGQNRKQLAETIKENE